jgi:hypothetical protein
MQVTCDGIQFIAAPFRDSPSSVRFSQQLFRRAREDHIRTELSLEVAGRPLHQIWGTVKFVGYLGSGDKDIVSHDQLPSKPGGNERLCPIGSGNDKGLVGLGHNASL